MNNHQNIVSLCELEIEEIAGGPGPLVPLGAAAARCAASAPCRNTVKVTAVAVAGAVATFFGYENNKT